jgi:chemotaxis protein methyltransferase CheR
VERPPLFTPEELTDFKAAISPLIGLDLDSYKPRQIERRITALMYRAKVTTLESFYEQLRHDPARLKDFVSGLTINVTEFFRNPERFEHLGAEILPALLKRFGHIKVWSAGCSQGAELFSVGMLLEELGALDRATLVGTDLDPKILEKAATGLFHDYEVRAMPERFMARHFEQVGPLFRFHGEAIRARCTFKAGNLLDDAPEPDCHLVMCRNVVIYFNDVGKKALYERVERGLVPGGILFVGNTERIFNPRDLGFTLLSPFYYQKATS